MASLCSYPLPLTGCSFCSPTHRRRTLLPSCSASHRLPLPLPRIQAEDLTAQLLRVSRLSDVAKLLSKFGARHVARVMYVLVRADAAAGARVSAMLLDCLAPTFAIR